MISKTFATLSSEHPPANPRMTSQWRAMSSSATVEPLKPLDSDSNSNEQAQANEAKQESVEQIKPDFHLFNALNTTRASLASLQEMSRSPAPKEDPLAEIRSLESSLVQASQVGSVGGIGGVNQSVRSASSAIGHQGKVMPVSKLSVVPSLRAGSIVMSGFGGAQSPLAQSLNAGQ